MGAGKCAKGGEFQFLPEKRFSISSNTLKTLKDQRITPISARKTGLFCSQVRILPISCKSAANRGGKQGRKAHPTLLHSESTVSQNETLYRLPILISETPGVRLYLSILKITQPLFRHQFEEEEEQLRSDRFTM